MPSRARFTLSLPPNVLLAIVCLGVFLASLDQTSVVTALPAVMIDLGVSINRLDSLAWVVTAYLLGFTVAMPLLGRAGDVYGYRLLYFVALLLFAIGSVGVALAPNLSWLITARVVQAVGGGALIPAAIALAIEGLPLSRRPIVFGIVGAAAEAGAVFGPLYGGTIVEWLGWRWVFWSNLPVVALLALALLAVPEVRRTQERLDVSGGVLLASGLSLLTVGLAQRSLFDAESAMPFLIIGAGGALMVALFFVERRAAAPIISRALFCAAGFAAAMSAQLLVGGALILVLVTVPLMTGTVFGEPALEGGLRLMRFTGAISVGAIVGGYAVRKFGSRPPAFTGLALAAVGFLLMATWNETIADPNLSLHLAIGGLGFGLVIAPLVVSAVDAAHEDYRATAAAWITAARMFGMTAGLAAMSAMGVDYFQSLTTSLATPIQFAGESSAVYAERVSEYRASLTGASFDVFTLFFRAGAVLIVLAAAPALWLRSHADRKNPAAAPSKPA